MLRFWHHHNGAVLIKIRAGQTLRHSHGGLTDEGWSRESNVWEFDGTTLWCHWETDGVDCDGRLRRYGECSCPAVLAKAGYLTEDGIAFPAWEEGKSGQRDYSAEAMGY